MTKKQAFGTHTYTGPTTKDGLNRGSGCLIVGKRAGGKLIKVDYTTTRFLVGFNQLAPVEKKR